MVPTATAFLTLDHRLEIIASVEEAVFLLTNKVGARFNLDKDVPQCREM